MTTQKPKYFGFTRVNLYIFIASLLLIIVGYILMSGGKSPNGVDFDSAVFNFRRITLAPVLCTIGYLGVIGAILYRPRKKLQ